MFGKRLKRKKREALTQVEDIYRSLPVDVQEYSFFTRSSHPQVWDEIDRQSLEDRVLSSCEEHQIGMPFSFVQDAQYSLKVDDYRKAIYIVVGESDFDFSKMVHYEDWINPSQLE